MRLIEDKRILSIQRNYKNVKTVMFISGCIGLNLHIEIR